MATVLKRTLFVGLGGTGATALLHTKKRFLDSFGEIPPMVGFLVIDTDKNTRDKKIERDNTLEKHKDKNKYVGLEANEFIHTEVTDALLIYKKKKSSLFNWVPEENVAVLDNMAVGAGQIRSNGRFSVFHNDRIISRAVKNKISAITDISIDSNTKYQPKDGDVEIHVVLSLAGGTGSGSFMDVAYLIRDATAGLQTTQTAFMVLPDVFNAMQQGVSMANTYPNAYGALVELDYFMREEIVSGNHDLSINFDSNQLKIRRRPYDVIFTINNETPKGDTINHIDDVAEQIGLSLFTGASELSASVDSAYDNVKKEMVTGEMDIEKKKAWACGMGAGELFYDGNTLTNIYANSVSELMLGNLLNTNNLAQGYANQFIDRGDIRIRENNDHDDLIDFLLPKSPGYPFDFDEKDDDINSSVNAYLTSVKTNATNRIEVTSEIKLGAVKDELKKFVEEITAKDCGVGNLGMFMTDFENQLNLFKEEMSEERSKLVEEEKQLEHKIKSEAVALNDLRGGMAFFKGNQIRDTKQSVIDQVLRNATVIHELLRRDYAIKFYYAILSDVQGFKSDQEKLVQRLSNVRDSIRNKRNALTNATQQRQKTFVLDLHKEELGTTTGKEDDFIIADFVDTLNPKSIYALASTQEDNIEKMFWNYTKTLQKSRYYVNRSVNEVLSDKSDDEIRDIARRLLDRSLSLWRKRYHGHIEKDIFNQFVIGLPVRNERIEDIFDNLLDANRKIEFVKTGITDKITCYRMEAAVPIFAVAGVSRYEKEYETKLRRGNPRSYFLDKNWKIMMDNENFSIWPKDEEDNSLPLWILGLAYGYIRLDEDTGRYELRSLEKGDPLDDYWLSLSDYREKAFQLFKNQDFDLELQKRIEAQQSEDGVKITKDKRTDIKANYIKKYAQLNLSMDDLKKPHHKATGDQVRAEIDYVSNKL